MITNAVRCAPPGNKPLPGEEAACRPFLAARIAALPRLKVIVTLGDVARRNVLKALGRPGSAGAPGHGARKRGRRLPDHQQLPLLPAEHEHRPPDASHVRSHFRSAPESVVRRT